MTSAYRSRRFEYVVLKPLAMSCMIWAVVYAVQRRWGVMIGLLIAAWLIGLIGQSLARRRTVLENAASDAAIGQLPEGVTPETIASALEDQDLYLATSAAFRTAFLLASILAAVAVIAGRPWYLTIAFGFSAYIGVMITAVFVSIYPSRAHR